MDYRWLNGESWDPRGELTWAHIILSKTGSKESFISQTSTDLRGMFLSGIVTAAHCYVIIIQSHASVNPAKDRNSGPLSNAGRNYRRAKKRRLAFMANNERPYVMHPKMKRRLRSYIIRSAMRRLTIRLLSFVSKLYSKHNLWHRQLRKSLNKADF